eukprot:Pgem_evm1s13125
MSSCIFGNRTTSIKLAIDLWRPWESIQNHRRENYFNFNINEIDNKALSSILENTNTNTSTNNTPSIIAQRERTCYKYNYERGDSE